MGETPLLKLDLRFEASQPLFEQVYLGLRQRILTGTLKPGERLPASRKLAEELGVSRTTIVTAYDQLCAEGFTEGRRGAGVFVSGIGPIELAPAPEPIVLSTEPTVKTKTLRPFHPGQPDMRLFPYRQWARCVSRVARTVPECLVASQHPFGDPELRTAICRYLAEWRGIRAEAEQVLITAGSGEALEICIRSLGAQIDSLALEEPCYPPLRAFATSTGLPISLIQTDRHGALPPENKLTKNLAVITPSSQFPQGGVLPQARRHEFVRWAQQTDSWIVEDDYDSEFRYAGQPVPALASLYPDQRIIYVGSFSKIFSSGIRLGFVLMPKHQIGNFAQTLSSHGGKASIAAQRPLALFMQSGEFYRHIRRVRRIYAERRTHLIAMLKTGLPAAARFHDHQAGMQIALELPPELCDVEISTRALEQGVSCPALSRYFAGPSPANGLLLGFCGFQTEEMNNAMAKLTAIIEAG